MGKVRVIKNFQEKEIIAKTGKILYVAQCMVNFIVDEQEEYIVNLFTPTPNLQPGVHEVYLNNINLRVKEPKLSTVPGIPGVSANNFAKKP